MLIIKGLHNSAVVYTNTLESAAKEQIYELCNQEFAADSKIRIMPDVHGGAGCTIGTTMTIFNKAVPNLVGVDIGCGMETIKISNKTLDVKKLDELIYNNIPSGFNIRKTPHSYASQIDLTALRCIDSIDLDRATKSIGTLGGGNHFIEANQDKAGDIYIVVHSGSRHLGLEIAKHYQNVAWEKLCESKIDKNAIIQRLKQEGRENEIQKTLKSIEKQIPSIPKELAYVEGDLFDDYIHDMKIAQQFATLNRKAIVDEIVRGFSLKIVEQFTTIHNYIDTDAMILRKGAVSAKAGEKLLIPINMRDGSIICIGKGNDEWNQSAPHGAGRLMSRTAAKQEFSLDEFKNQMQGVYTTSVNADTLDECPMAYKSIDDIVANISETAEILEIVKPIYNFKASS